MPQSLPPRSWNKAVRKFCRQKLQTRGVRLNSELVAAPCVAELGVLSSLSVLGLARNLELGICWDSSGVKADLSKQKCLNVRPVKLGQEISPRASNPSGAASHHPWDHLNPAPERLYFISFWAFRSYLRKSAASCCLLLVPGTRKLWQFLQ